MLAKVSAWAKSLLVVLVPYREYDRIDEHVATFDQANIQASVAGRFQLIHAQVMDASGVVFVGGKIPDKMVIKSATMNNITLLSTPHLIYECCGRLFSNGIRGDKKKPG